MVFIYIYIYIYSKMVFVDVKKIKWDINTSNGICIYIFFLNVKGGKKKKKKLLAKYTLKSQGHSSLPQSLLPLKRGKQNVWDPKAQSAQPILVPYNPPNTAKAMKALQQQNPPSSHNLIKPLLAPKKKKMLKPWAIYYNFYVD